MTIEEPTQSCMSVADRLIAMMPCDDNTCCCIPKRSTVVAISIINFLGCVIDLITSESCLNRYCEGREFVDSLKKLLVSLFQVANLMLLVASIFENALLVDIYVWYTLGHIVMAFVVTIYEFVTNINCEGTRSFISFVPEVVFLFVIFRCLPLVDLYRRHLYSVAAAAEPKSD